MYGDVKVFDVHGHVSIPINAYATLAVMLGANTPMPSPQSPAAGRFGVDEDDFRIAAENHVQYIDERNIDVQIIGPRPFVMLGWMAEHLLPVWTDHVNEMIHRQCSFFPDRFAGACQLPQASGIPDSSALVPVLERTVNEYGFVAAYVSPDPSGLRDTPGMDNEFWYPLYEASSSMNVPLIVHGTASQDPRFRTVPHNYQLAFMTEQYLARQFLSHSDVFDRFPDLRIIICHCGGALDRFIPTDPHLGQRDLSANLFCDSCGYDLIFLEASIRQRGVDQICFGSEAPGSGRFVRPETGRSSDDLVPVLAEMDSLTDVDRRRIFYDNPRRVLPGLEKF